MALAIESEIYNYAKSNLAIINIFIKVFTVPSEFIHFKDFIQKLSEMHRSHTASGSERQRR